MNREQRRSSKVKSFQTPPQPRTMDEIKKQNSELTDRAAQVQYMVYAYTKELARLNEALSSVLAEAQQRQAIDEAAAKQAQPEQPVQQ